MLRFHGARHVQLCTAVYQQHYSSTEYDVFTTFNFVISIWDCRKGTSLLARNAYVTPLAMQYRTPNKKLESWTRLDFLFERSEFLIDTSQKKVRVCVRLILVLVGKTLILVLVWGTYYVPYTYVPGISRQKSHHMRSIEW